MGRKTFWLLIIGFFHILLFLALTYLSLVFIIIILFNWRLITILWWLLPCIDMNQPQVYMCPHPEPPSHLPPHPIPQGCPSTLALSTLFHASNLDWSSISHMVIYMFQCYSLKTSHPRLLPQSPKVCVFYICVSFAVSCKGLSLPSF